MSSYDAYLVCGKCGWSGSRNDHDKTSCDGLWHDPNTPAEAGPREWTLRISSENDGSGYIFSGSDVSYPEDDYLEVVEKSALAAANERARALVEALEIVDAVGMPEPYDKIVREALAKWRG